MPPERATQRDSQVSAGQQNPLEAGNFSTWLAATSEAIGTGLGSEVPCGDCTACCTSSYFVHIQPHEAKTLSRIPAQLLFEAPGLPDGHVLMGYNQDGHCPMLVDCKCSIYEDRPITCRTFDCRVFAAAGLEPDVNDKPLIAQRVRRWEFELSDLADHALAAAVRAAAIFLAANPACFPNEVVPSGPSDLAVAAIKVHRLFLVPSDDARWSSPDIGDVQVAMRVASGDPSP